MIKGVLAWDMRQRKRQKYSNSVYKSFALIMQFGVNMLVPILLCTFLGIFIDRKAGTSFWVVIFFFVGALAGGRNIYMMAKEIFDNGSRRDAERTGEEHSDRE